MTQNIQDYNADEIRRKAEEIVRNAERTTIMHTSP